MSKPEVPGVTRASIVVVWHLGQSGRGMVMMLRLESGGSNTLSVTDGYQYRAVMEPICNNALGRFVWYRDCFYSRSFIRGFSCKTALNSEL
jgi:hypothetical protein